MKEYLTYMVEMTVCSGILYLFYRLLIDGKAPLNFCRAYLTGSVIAAAAIPLLRIPVYPGKTVYLAPLADLPAITEGYLPAAPQTDGSAILALLYAAVALCAVGLLGYNAWKIARFRRSARLIRKTGDYTLLENSRIGSPFSFFRYIFIKPGFREDELTQIVSHELSHIRHRHSAELMAMELLKSLFWFNPFVWITRHSLGEVHEFQADRDVLDEGFDPGSYRILIFKQLFGCTPDLTSGLIHSRTKKRFVMMCKKNPTRRGILRLAAVAPLTAGLVVLFGFTGKPPVYINSPAAQSAGNAIVSVSEAPFPLSPLRSEPTSAVTKVHKSTDKNTRITIVGDSPTGSPLIVLNGETTGKKEIELEVEQITSSKVLQPDEAVALLGAEAKHGAILITTKQGSNTTSNGALLPSAETSVGRRERAPESASSSPSATGNPSDEKAASEKNAEKIRQRQDALLFYISKPTSEINDPLVVIDGVPDKEGKIRKIDPGSVESTSFLKKEAATQIYGPDAKNGVILITTKGGGKERAKTQSPQKEDDTPYATAETMPVFQGGDLNAFRQWVAEKLIYPEEAVKNGLQGKVIVNFVVEKDGSLGRFRMLRSPDKALTEEIYRILKLSPKWTPGKQDGKTVAVIYTLPIDFKLSEPQRRESGLSE